MGATVKVGECEIQLDRVNAARMLDAAKEAGLKIDAELPVKNQVKIFAKHFIDTIPGGETGSLVECGACGAPNDANQGEICPFCLHIDGQPILPVVTKEEEADEEEPKKAKSNGYANGHANGKAHAPQDRASTKALAKVDNVTSIVSKKEAELDDAVAELRRRRDEINSSAWHFGQAIASVIQKDLWKARSKDRIANGKPYKDFDDFVKQEVGISGRHARILVDSFRAFTEKQAAALGAKKMLLLLPAPVAVRDEIAEKAIKEKLPSSKVRDAVTEARATYAKDHGGKLPTRSEGRAGTNTSSKEAPEKSEMVTCAMKIGTSLKAKLFADGKEDKPALLKTLTGKKARAQGTVDLSNRVRLFVEVKEAADGQLVVDIKPKRIK